MTRPLPIFKTGNSMAHKILGGWSLDGVYTYTSGSDFSIGTGTDYAGVGPGGGTQYWVVNGPLRVTDQYSQGGTAADPNFYFQPTTSSGTAEFTPPPAGTINPQRVRDMFYGPGAYYINSAPFKDFRINERMKFTVPIPRRPRLRSARSPPNRASAISKCRSNLHSEFDLEE
jgi:hypothetical protein